LTPAARKGKTQKAAGRREPFMELYPRVHQIQSLYGGRNLFQYLFAGANTVLVDTGIAETPEKTIFPYLDRLSISPARLTMAITTHADLDHQGGNDTLKRLAPQALLACGEQDRELVEDPRALFARRYNFLKGAHGVGLDDEPWPDAGRPCRMDLTFAGGERIALDDGWQLEVLHVPGHSRGHLAFYDRTHRAAFVGDAIHGRGCPKAAGGMAIPVTYYDVDVYLSTLRYFENLPMDVLYSGHWPVMRGEEIGDFIADSRRTVELLDRAILGALEKNPAGLTLSELIDAAAQAVGEWPEEGKALAMFPVKGHMDRLEQGGRARLAAGRPAGERIRWQLA
jgi:glyoxylase-like metal-dependent hydrolase (beta-lactamase superfamily II)